MLGSGGFIVFDESTNILDIVLNLQSFYSHESCGQCTPCREGAHWVQKVVARLATSKGLPTDMILLKDICSQIAGHTICPFGDALVTPVLSFMQKFPLEFQASLESIYS